MVIYIVSRGWLARLMVIRQKNIVNLLLVGPRGVVAAFFSSSILHRWGNKQVYGHSTQINYL